MLECREAFALLPHLALEDLPEDERVALRRHLDGCAECRAQYEACKSLLPALQADLRAVPIPQLAASGNWWRENLPEAEAEPSEDEHLPETWREIVLALHSEATYEAFTADEVERILDLAGAGDAAANSGRRTGWQRAARFGKAATLAAALALAASGLWLAAGDWRLATGDGRFTKEVLPVASRQSPVEILHHWGACNLEVPERLPGTLRLNGGMVKARLGSGTEMILFGPLEMEVCNPMEVKLAYGRMLADVPEAARGFTVRTPDFEMWDYGALYSAATSEQGSDIFVFKGEVQVNEVSGDPVDICRDGEGARTRRDRSGVVKVAADWPEAESVLAAAHRQGILNDPEAAVKAAGRISDMWAERWTPKVVEAGYETQFLREIAQAQEVERAMRTRKTRKTAAKLAAAVLGIAATAEAAEIFMTAVDDQWDNPSTWVGSVVPGAADQAVVEGTGQRTIRITNGVAAVAERLSLAKTTGDSKARTGHCVMSGGSLTLSGHLLMASAASAHKATFTLSDGTANIANGRIGQAGSALFTQTGGTLASSYWVLGQYIGSRGTNVQSAGEATFSTANGLRLGEEAGSSGIYQLSGTAVINLPGEARVGNGGQGRFEQSGGTIIGGSGSSSQFTVGQGSSSSGAYLLSGGDLSIYRLNVGW
ncbi:MAG: zf-HC2 domain-containing protein, partial [Kiritimatiellae bacterium]|nr:zf-HC2 domain-containing protein [Kiritimatiellia bacterium]